MKHGFMLIELIVVTLISSMVGGILLTALSQGSRFQVVVDNIVDTSLRISIASNQLEKDLMGAFIPVQAQRSQEEEQSPDAQVVVTDDKKVSDKKPDEKAAAKKEKPKPIEKIFYSTNKESNLDQLTFITNNPLSVFVGKDVGVVKPKIVRVMYTLKPEADKENSYALYRQESLNLDVAQIKNVKSYELIGGIKNLSVTYTARIEKKQEASKGAEGQSKPKEKPKISYEYKTSKDWVSERKKESEKEQEFSRIPYSIEIKIVLWDRQDKNEKEFIIVSEIPVDFVSDSQESLPDASAKQAEPPKNPDTVQQGASKNITQQSPKTAHNNHGEHTEVLTTIQLVDSLTNTLKNLTKILG